MICLPVAVSPVAGESCQAGRRVPRGFGRFERLALGVGRVDLVT